MKMMQGACFLPCSKRSRTRLAPTPTNISTKSGPEMLELLGVFEEGDDLLDLVLGLVDAGDVGEGDLVLRVAQHAGLGLAERHGLAAARLELPHEEEEHDADEEHRQQRHERRRPEGRGVVLLEVDLELAVLG